MKSTLDTYNERVAEIDFYYDALGQLDLELTESFSMANLPDKKYKHDDFLKILKANALIMIYNLVESTVRNGIEEIYDKLSANGATYTTVRKEIQDIWFSYKFGQVYHQPEASYISYKGKALEIVNSIMIGETVELNGDALSLGGNLNAEKIFMVCNNHGIEFKPDSSCKGGKRLEDVRAKRNGLAHGNFSFAECGRDYSYNDLIEIKKQTYVFLSGLLEGMNNYYDTEGYLNTYAPCK